jgi:hypothetical protein
LYRGFRRLPWIKWPDKRPELFRPPPVAHVRGVPGGPGRADMGMLPAAPRPAPGRRRPGPGRPARDRPGIPSGPSPGPLGHRPELLRFAGCGQASRRLRPGDGGPGGPGGARLDRCGAGSGPRPAPGRAAAGNAPDHGSPARSSRTSDFHRANCAIIADQACNGLQRFTKAAPGRGGIRRRSIRMKSTASRYLRLTPGVTGTPWAPPAGRAQPRARAVPGRSARCRPARAGPPVPRLRRAPGRAGRPGRTGPSP